MKWRFVPDVDHEDLQPRVKEQFNRLQSCAQSLLEEVHALEELVGRLNDEIAILKGEKKRPVFKPSRMNEKAGDKENKPLQESVTSKRPGSQKKSKTGKLTIDRDCVIEPGEPIPPGSRFKGYRDFIVQDIVIITPLNTRYRLARWETPDGRYLTGQLPAELHKGHFGLQLVSYVLYQHHHCQVTQPLLREQLSDWGINISIGQIDAILQKNKERFHVEKDALLSRGLALSSYVTVDDTSSRHQGNNGFVTHIGNEYFAWFQSSASKSRVNFLELLRAGQTDYRINEDALSYMKEQRLSHVFVDALRNHAISDFADQNAWHAHMDALGMDAPRYRQIATEGAGNR